MRIPESRLGKSFREDAQKARQDKSTKHVDMSTLRKAGAKEIQSDNYEAIAKELENEADRVDEDKVSW